MLVIVLHEYSMFDPIFDKDGLSFLKFALMVTRGALQEMKIVVF